MNIRLALAERWLPAFLRRKELVRLFKLTAEAFDAPLPALSGRAFDPMLETYSRWTSGLSASVAEDEIRSAAIRTRLRDLAFAFGRSARNRLGLRTRGQVIRGARLLYGILSIDFQGAPDGDIVINRCFFSRDYTPKTCALMSGLDEGVLAGLSGGGRLKFSARITENKAVCRARFEFQGGGP